MTNGAKPLISIVTVNLNQADKLKTTMESVHNQSFKNKEHIVIDGGSTDKSVGVIRQYESRLAHWVSEPDAGIYPAMNKGIEAAKGPWIQFLNAGDTYVDDVSLETIANSLDTEFWLVYCDIFLKKKDNSITFWRQNPVFRFGLFNNVCHQAIFYNLGKYPDMRYDTRFEVSADAGMLLEIGSKAGWNCFKKIEKPLVIYEEEGLSFDKAYKALKSREEHFKRWIKNPMIKMLNLANLKRQQMKYVRSTKKKYEANG